MRVPAIILAAAMAVCVAAPAPAAPAKSHTVKMLNRSAAGVMVFEPNIIRIRPSESVTFMPNDLGHNAETIPGMLPAGAQPFKRPMNKALTVTFTKPGVYGYKCSPHYSMGMVGVVVVGAPANLAQAKAVTLPGLARKVMAKLLASVG